MTSVSYVWSLCLVSSFIRSLFMHVVSLCLVSFMSGVSYVWCHFVSGVNLCLGYIHLMPL